MTQTLLDRRHALIGHAPLFYEQPVHIVRGEGAVLYDADGKRYIDMYNNVPCVGHANPRVAEAMAHQLGTLNVHSRYLHEGILDYAERLISLHHDGIESVVFACSGTEASEIALFMARGATGGQGFICTDATYHGNSAEVIKLARASLTDEDPDRLFRAVPVPQTYRPIGDGLSDKELCDTYLGRIQAEIDAFESAGIPFAGMFVCSIFANEGLPTTPEGFMAKAADIVHAAGGLMIADEVQAGFCRSGDWWGYETSDFVPDIVTMGKPMGNGMPLSATAASNEIVETFRRRNGYFNTFASSPLQAATGMAVLDEIHDRDLLKQSRDIGETMREALRALQPDCEFMGDVRGCGLFTGIDWVTDKASRTPDHKGAIKVANAMKDRGILLSNAGAHRNVIKIRPPLVFQQDHAEEFIATFTDVVNNLGAV